MVAAAVSVAAIVCSCVQEHTEPAPTDVIYSADGFSVTLDAIVEGSDTLPLPVSVSDSAAFELITVSPMLNRLINAVDTVAATDGIDVSELSNWELATRIGLYEAWSNPDGSKELLRERVRNGHVVSLKQIEEYWPMISDCLPWIPAAEEVYYATGDHRWLREVADVAHKTLRREADVNFMEAEGLFRGVPVYLMTPTSHFAPWMRPADIVQSFTLFNNSAALAAIESLGRMTDILGGERDQFLDSICGVIEKKLKRLLWLPDRGYYSEFIYGGVYPVQSQIADNMGQAMAMLTKASTPAMRRMIVERTPRFPLGMSLTMPLMSDEDLPGRQMFFTTMQSMWTIASFRTVNNEATCQSLAALCLAVANRRESPATALRQIALRGFLGMEANDSGVIFSPFVPEILNGVTVIRNIPLRDATLDVRLEGSGGEIGLIELDGQRYTTCGVPYTLQGHHTLSVKLNTKEGAKNAREVTIADTVFAPVAPQVFWCNLSGKILNFEEQLSYDVYVDGVLEDETRQQNFDLDDTPDYSTANFVAVDENGWAGLAGRTFNYFPPRTRFVVPADTIEPWIKGRVRAIRGPRGRVIRRIREPHIVRMADWRRELRFGFNMRDSGEYVVYIVYASSEKDVSPKPMTLRRVKVNGVSCGFVVMPSTRPKRMQESSPVRARLKEGKNYMSISTDPLLTVDRYGRHGEVLIKEIILVKLSER